jgi:hypothetical protein
MWRAGVAGLILAATPAAAFAHDSFLAPSGALSAGQPIRLQVGSGEFPATEHGIRPDRVARIAARAAGTPLSPRFATGDTALHLTLDWPEATPPHQNGVVVALDLSPIDIEVGADEIDHYMDEIGAPADVAAAARAAVARDGVMRETYTKHLKLMACVAGCDGLAPAEPSGSALEFVASDEAWQLLENGEPRAGQAVFVTTAAQGRRRLTTDRQGRILLPADTTGPAFLSAVVLTPPAQAGGRFTSEWAALTIDASVR